MNISVVIPTYNGKNLLEKNLPFVLDALKAHKNGNKEIVIADDASTDDSIAFLEEFAKKHSDNVVIQIIKSTHEKERGFSKNVNRGVKATNGDVVVLLNSDVRPHKDFLSSLLSHFINKNVFAVGCLDESIENGQIVRRGRGIGKWERGFLMHKAGVLTKTNTLWVSGGSGAFRKSLWDKLGGLNELYNPFYWEDIDLSYRAQKAGYEVIFEPKSKVVHEHEKGTIQTTVSQEKVTTIAYRNQCLFVWLNITEKKLLLHHILWVSLHISSAVLKRNETFVKGFFMALLLFPKVLLYKQQMEKQFVRRDSDILAPFNHEFSK